MDKTLAQLADELRAHLQLAPGELLYGVVDGAQDLELAYEARCLYGKEIHSLFEGEMAPALAEVAPYLVPIDPDSGYLENWARRWGKNAGILLTTMDSARRFLVHLRTVFIAQSEEGRDYFFRYYDPRVLGAFLPTCTGRELVTFFGPIRSITAETQESFKFVRFQVSPETILAKSPW